VLTENYFQFWIYTDQIRNKNYKNLSKRNFALSKIDNLYEYFLPIFVIFIEQIIVRKIETSGSHSGYRFDLSFFCPLIMIEVNRLYDHLIKLSLMIVGTFQDTCSALCCHSSDQSERERERGATSSWDRVGFVVWEPINWLRDIDCLSLFSLTGGWLDILFIQMFPEIMKDNWVAWLLGWPGLCYCFHEVALLKWSFLRIKASFLHWENSREELLGSPGECWVLRTFERHRGCFGCWEGGGEVRCVMMMDDGIWLRFKIHFSPP